VPCDCVPAQEIVRRPGTISKYHNGAFVSEHGSWDRSSLSGYSVVHVAFVQGKPVGVPEPVVTGFYSDDESKLYGAPVGLAQDNDGALLIADDVGDAVWRVTVGEVRTELLNGIVAPVSFGDQLHVRFASDEARCPHGSRDDHRRSVIFGTLAGERKAYAGGRFRTTIQGSAKTRAATISWNMRRDKSRQYGRYRRELVSALNLH